MAPEVIISSTLLPWVLSAADLIHRVEIGTEKRRPWWQEAVTGAGTPRRGIRQVADAIERLSEHDVSALPVVDEAGNLVGSIARMSAASEQIDEQHVEARGQHHRHRQSQYPRHRNVAECRQL